MADSCCAPLNVNGTLWVVSSINRLFPVTSVTQKGC